MGINPATLYDWKNKYPKISESLKKGKEVVDIQVENALLKRALGYDYQEQRIEKSDKDGTKTSRQSAMSRGHDRADLLAQKPPPGQVAG